MKSFLQKWRNRSFFYVLCLSVPLPLLAEDILVAVASNFSSTAEEIAQEFEAQTGHKVLFSIGSTGQHYAQIINNAPFDVFLAADAERATLLENSGHAQEGSRFTYALGVLVLWSPNHEIEGEKILSEQAFQYLSMANPKHAPYGQAAVQTLQSINLYTALAKKIVLGENVAQSFQFVQSGAADIGFVSMAQILKYGEYEPSNYWLVDEDLYEPINQQAVLLSDKESAEEFMQFLGSSRARQIISQSGYGLEHQSIYSSIEQD